MIRSVVVPALLAALSTPCWAQSWPPAPGFWWESNTNTIKDLDPCPARNCAYSGDPGHAEGVAGVIDDWNGGVYIEQENLLVVFGGGHLAYYGSELYAFDVMNTQSWIRWTEPVDPPICNYSTGSLQDGSPCASHTYDTVEYDPNNNAFVRIGTSSLQAQGGGQSGHIHSFSFSNNPNKIWTQGTESMEFDNFVGATAAYDPLRKAFWVITSWGKNDMGRYNIETDDWVTYRSQGPIVNIDSVSAIDPTRDIMVTVDGRNEYDDPDWVGRVLALDLSDPLSSFVLNTSGDKAMQKVGGTGFEWDPVNRIFVGWRGGPHLWGLFPPEGDWRTGTWQWQKILPDPSNTVEPDAPNRNKTYSRFRYIPDLHAFIVINSVTSNTYIFRMPVLSGTGLPAPDRLSVR